MKTLIALFGKSGSGKDFILKKITEKYGYNAVKRMTSRPMREKESQGNPYIFCKSLALQTHITENLDEYIEVGIFNEWLYATHISSLDDGINIGSYDVEAVEQLLQATNIKVFPVYLSCTDKTRMLRQLDRETTPDVQEICRRFINETRMYSKIDFDYYTVNNEFSKNVLEEINQIVVDNKK
jgi:guanylate kinase